MNSFFKTIVTVTPTSYPYNVAYIYYNKKLIHRLYIIYLFIYLLFDKQEIILQNLYFNDNYIIRHHVTIKPS